MMRSPRIGGLLAAAVVACASSSASVARREYILAHAHGWVEISIADADVPDLPVVRDGKQILVRPDTCSVYVELDGEPFVSGTAYPVGTVAPYRVETGFRFPAPVGSHVLELSYGGCDVEAGERSSTSVELPIVTEERQVSEVRFDGQTFRAEPVRVDPVVTLDDVYELLTGRSKGSP
jgi:hypothetical protein